MAAPKFSNTAYRDMDRLVADKGWGIYPETWHQFWSDLHAQINKSDRSIVLENPLILGGSSASDLEKRHRFLGHLLVAQTIGKLDWALEYLDRLGPREWYGPVDTVLPEQPASILYITGRGGSLDRGYVNILKTRCFDFDGVELNGEFLKLDHLNQLNVISGILRHYANDIIIANSYGAYLILCVLAEEDISLNNVFLHSPITGSSTLQRTFFRPAGARAVERAIEECAFEGTISNLFVVVGGDDQQCDPERCQMLAAAFRGVARVIPNQGHQIAHLKLEKCTDQFFSMVD